MRRWIIVLIAGALVADLALLLTGNHVLIGERYVSPGERVVVGGVVSIGEAPEEVCTFWTGRKIVQARTGVDRCPMFLDAEMLAQVRYGRLPWP